MLHATEAPCVRGARSKANEGIMRAYRGDTSAFYDCPSLTCALLVPAQRRDRQLLQVRAS
jgi:hypothetical protein